jgi:hypothetical protein
MTAAETFPSVGWFRALATRMAARPEAYRRLGGLDLTLVPRIVFPDGRSESYSLEFRGHTGPAVAALAPGASPRGRHPVVLEGDYAAWREMVENIRRHGHADLTHTLNYLTLPDWPLRLIPTADDDQLDVDRFYRYNESLQQFFDEAAGVETRFRDEERA